MPTKTLRRVATACVLVAASGLDLACGGTSHAPAPRTAKPPAPIAPVLRGGEPDVRLAAVGTGAGRAPAVLRSDEPAPEPEAKAPRIGKNDRRARLPEGRSVVEIELAAGETASIGVFGPRDALLGFELLGPRALIGAAASPLDEDGMLPRVVSVRPPPEDVVVVAVVDASAPIEIVRVSTDPSALAPPPPRALRLGQAEPRPLVGLPVPIGRDDGYLLGSPGRYQFLRLDVAVALQAALRQTRVRFRRDPIVVGDASQWDGGRPASDLEKPRHISHVGGRDVDLGLPADDGEPSSFRRHCTGVLVEADVQGCAPGTVRGLDALRLAYLLGLLVDQSRPHTPVEKILTDEVYVREVQRVLDVLRERRWIKEAGLLALSEDGILKPSPWHTDHVHVRFAGEPGRPLW